MAKYTKHKHIDGAQELLTRLHEPLEELDKDIQELEAKKAELQKGLENPDSHKLADIEKNKHTQYELNLVNKALDKAKRKREAHVSENHEAYKEAMDLLKAHRAKLEKKHHKTNKEIIQKLYEIRGLYEEMKKDNAEEIKKVSDFIDDMGAFSQRELTPIERRKFGNTTLKHKLMGVVTDPFLRGYHGLIFTTLPEHIYGVQGLLVRDKGVKPKKMAKGTEQQWNDLFNQ